MPETSKRKQYRYVILLITCLCGISSGYFQYQLSPVAQEIMQQYGLSRTQYATIFSAPMIPAIALSLIAGIIVDKTGAKRTVGLCLALAAAALWGRVFAGGYAALYVCMLLPGIAATFVNATSAKIFSGWFDAKATSVAVGVYLASSSLGMAIATATTAALPSVRFAFTLSAILSTATAVLWMLFMRDGESASAPGAKRPPVLETVKSVIRNRDILLTCISIFCVYGCYMVLGSFLPMLLQTKGMDSVAAGAAASMQSFGRLAGCLILPALSAKLGKLRLTFVSLALAGAGLTLLITFLPAGGVTAALIFLAGMCLGGILPLFLSLPVRIPSIGEGKAGTAGGTIATFELLGAVLIPGYIISPIAGDSTTMLFVLGAVFSAAGCVFAALMSREVE